MPTHNDGSEPKPVGLPALDGLTSKERPELQDYLNAVSEYVVSSQGLTAEAKKSAQIALSGGLARCLRQELMARLPTINPHAGELDVAGALRTARADVSESHQLDGLRLAIELKPVNLAVGRAIWNRFGDVRAFAVNIHLKFPFAIVGGVLVVPTWEWAKITQRVLREADADQLVEIEATSPYYKRPTLGLLDRLVSRLQRTRRRESEADAPHLLEAVTVVIYDPDTSQLHTELPPVGSGLRWNEFVDELVEMYDLRFE